MLSVIAAGIFVILFAEHCYQCHSAKSGQAKGGLRLDSRAGWQVGGDGGGWLVGHGPTLANTTTMFLAIDEDQLSDPDRSHLDEQDTTSLAVPISFSRMGT